MAERARAGAAGKALVLGLLLLGGTAAALPVPVLLGALEHVARVQHNGGGGLWIHEGYAYSSGLGGGFFVTDVRDPARPVKVGSIPGVFMRDADVYEVGGRTIAVAASEGPGTRFIDVTDPTRPAIVATLDPGNTHNLAVVPGTTLVYNSRGGGSAGPLRLDIMDGAVPERPVLVKTWTSPSNFNGQSVSAGSCHDIHVSPEVDRAYCAGGGATVILDIADPLNPAILGVIKNRFINYHHWAVPSNDHSVLILGDEDFGPATPACAGVPAPVGAPTTFAGALWFYGIADPANAVPLGWIAPPDSAGTCTAHFGQVLPGQNRLVAGFYRGGVILVDFTVPALPRVAAHYLDGSNVWDVRYWDGHVFTGDIGRGMDVLKVT